VSWRHNDAIQTRRLDLFLFCSNDPCDTGEEKPGLAGRRIYTKSTERKLDLDQLAAISDEEADNGEEYGLECNQHYRDLRGITWDQLDDALEREKALFQRFAAASDLDREAELYEDEREEAFLPEEDLWGLGVGVIGATLALSALGATTVSSCNAGGFGGRHVAAIPYVAFFLPRAVAAEVMAIAEEADVGLDLVSSGIARLYGGTDYDLHRFGHIALDRHRKGS
jgi:hypothetical protein